MTYAPPCPTQTQHGATVHDFPAPTSAPDSGFMGLSSTKQHRFQAISTPRDNLNSNLDNLLQWMEEILHHLEWLKPYK